MIVHGKDHDMLMIAYVFNLYGNPIAEQAAYNTATDHPEEYDQLSANDLMLILESGALDTIYVQGDKARVWQTAKWHSAKGHVVLARIHEQTVSDEPLWHLLHDPVGDRIGTLMMHQEPGAAIMAEDIADAFCGEAVIVAHIVPGWKGTWKALLGM